MRNSRSVGLTLTRIAISLIIIKDIFLYLLSYKTLFGSTAIEPASVYSSILRLYGLSGLQHVFDADSSVLCLLIAGLSFAALFFFGVFKKVAGLALFFILLLLKFRNIYIMDGGDNLIVVLLPMIALGYSRPLLSRTAGGQYYRVPRLLRVVDVEFGQLMPIAIMIQVCIVYFFAALYKIPGPLWENGTAVFYVMRVDDFRWTALNILLTKYYIFVKLLTYGTIVWEITFPFLVWQRTAKIVTVCVSVAMHLGIFLFMHIDNYSFVMIASYFVFFTNNEYNLLNRALRSRFVPRQRSGAKSDEKSPVLLFDSRCLMCNGFVQFLLRIDTGKRLMFASLHSEYSKSSISYQLSPNDSAVLLSGTSRHLESDAILRAIAYTGGFWRLIVIFQIIPKPVRDICYRLVARNRYLWGENNGSCIVPTPEISKRFIT